MKSMTGYGRFEGEQNGNTIQVEIRSVNHRYCEIALRMPRNLNVFEDLIKHVIQQKIHRGRVEVFIQVSATHATDKQLVVDRRLARAYYEAAMQLKQDLGLAGELALGDLMNKEDLFEVQESTDPDQLEPLLLAGVSHAVDDLLKMRVREGEALAKDLAARLEQLEQTVLVVAGFAPQVKEDVRQKLEERIREFLGERVIPDEGRLLQEVAYFAEKSNVDEELTRLSSHIGQFRKLMDGREPVGRKLDFLLQEMNREVNTIGSKAHTYAISHHVVEMKSELEKMREQVQNIE